MLFSLRKVFLEAHKVEARVLPRISDHNMIIVDISRPDAQQKIKEGPAQEKHNFKRADYTKIQEIFHDLKQKNEGKNVDQMWIDFKKAISESLDKHVPKLLNRPKGQSWMIRDLLRAMRQRDDLYTDFLEQGIFNDEREKAKSKEVKKLIKKAKKDFMDIHVSDELDKGNVKPLYNFINKHKGQSNQISSIKNSAPDQIKEFVTP
jgi:hypothetical protein